MEANLMNAVSGAIGGAFSSVIAYLKAKNKATAEEKEKFDTDKLLESMLEGLVGGAVIGAIAMSPYAAFGAGLGINMVLDIKKLKYTSQD